MAESAADPGRAGARLRVAVLGAHGRMGTRTCVSITDATDLELVAQLGRGDDLAELAAARAQVLVEYSPADAVLNHVRFAAEHGIHAVVGTSGIDADRTAAITGLLRQHPGVGVLVVPNFALGAVLAQRFTRQAARFFASAEIIELHHAGKADAPSGTAAATAATIGAARTAAGLGDVPDATTVDPGHARGATVAGVHVHAVRLPGLVAHQEVLLANPGELLTIRHDSFDRSSFMPGVLAAIRAAPHRPGLTVGLEQILGLDPDDPR